MGFIATIVEIKGRKIKIDSGGGNIITADLYLPPGDDSKPLKMDYVAAMFILKSGAAVVIDSADLQNALLTDEGEKRIYSRNKSTGDVVAEIWLKNTGEISINNNSGTIVLEPSGVCNINGATIDTSGNITAPSITIGGISFSSHLHGGVTTGAGVTGVPQ